MPVQGRWVGCGWDVDGMWMEFGWDVGGMWVGCGMSPASAPLHPHPIHTSHPHPIPFPTAVGYPPATVGYRRTVSYRQTAFSCPPSTIGSPPNALSHRLTAVSDRPHMTECMVTHLPLFVRITRKRPARSSALPLRLQGPQTVTPARCHRQQWGRCATGIPNPPPLRSLPLRSPATSHGPAGFEPHLGRAEATLRGMKGWGALESGGRPVASPHLTLR